jgi:hypothetical protein
MADADTRSHSVNLGALKRVDPYAVEIVETGTQVAIYKFNSQSNEWVRWVFFVTTCCHTGYVVTKLEHKTPVGLCLQHRSLIDNTLPFSIGKNRCRRHLIPLCKVSSFCCAAVTSSSRCHNNPFSCSEPCTHLSWYLNHRWVLILSNSNSWTTIHLVSLFRCTLGSWTFLGLSNQVGKPISRHPNFIISWLQSSLDIFLQLTWILYFIHNLTAGCKVASQRKCGTEDVAVCAFPQP